MSIRTSFTGAAKQVARCAACHRPPERITERVEVDGGVTLVAYCHGSKQEIQISEEAIEDRQFQRALAALSDLFPDDNFPDMVELLRYNKPPHHGWSP